ncbi:MAG: VanZ family protein [Nitrospirota bacterium]
MKPEDARDLALPRPTARAITVWWVTVTVYAGAIFGASSTPHPLGVHTLPPFVDKVVHALVYGGLSFTVWMALRSSAPSASTRRLSLFAIVLTALYGLTDEVHQSFVPGRSMEMLDLAADAGGAGLVQGGMSYGRRSRGPNPGNPTP